MADTSVYLAEGSATDGVAEVVKDIIKGSRVRYSIDDDLVWTDLSSSDQAQFKRGLYAAVAGEC